jgi:hypothetical protein
VFVSSSSVALSMTNGTGSTAILRRNFARKKAPDEQATPKRANVFVRAPGGGSIQRAGCNDTPRAPDVNYLASMAAKKGGPEAALSLARNQ